MELLRPRRRFKHRDEQVGGGSRFIIPDRHLLANWSIVVRLAECGSAVENK